MRTIFTFFVKLSLFIFFILLFSIPRYYEIISRSQPLKIIIHVVIFAWIISFLNGYFYKYVIKSEKLVAIMRNLLLGIYAVIVIFLFLEIIFTFIPQSHGVGYTFGSKNWFMYYWKTNSEGYRDTEPSLKDKSKKKIFFLGDSFTAGHGNKNPDNRYSNIVGEKLKEKYEFFNFGKNGLNSDDEFEILIEKSSLKPDIIVLQYFGNDIENAGLAAGKKFNMIAYEGLGFITKQIVCSSYLANYFYWQFPRMDSDDYVRFLTSSYRDSTIFARHLSTLNKFAEYSRSNNVKLIVVVFPFLKNFELSKLYTVPVNDFFRKNNIATINVADFASKIPDNERVVNNNDFHPSVKLNELVADEILSVIDPNHPQ